MKRKSNKLTAMFTTLLTSALVMSAFAFPVGAETSETVSNVGSSTIIDTVGSKGENTLVSKDKLSQVKADELGNITVTLSDGAKGTVKKDIEFSCLKVADIVAGEYVLLDEYSSLDLDLNDIKNASDLEEISVKIADVASYGETLKTDANGKLTFDELEVGVYLIEATDIESNEKYDEVTPLLVSIPTFDEDKGQMKYDLNVIPKHEERKTPTPEKPSKGSPSTDAPSYSMYYFGGAAGVLVLLVVVNKVWKSKGKKA